MQKNKTKIGYLLNRHVADAFRTRFAKAKEKKSARSQINLSRIVSVALYVSFRFGMNVCWRSFSYHVRYLYGGDQLVDSLSLKHS